MARAVLTSADRNRESRRNQVGRKESRNDAKHALHEKGTHNGLLVPALKNQLSADHKETVDCEIAGGQLRGVPHDHQRG
jgi:hypothetical protein